MSNVIQFPVIAGVEIVTDEFGRYNLNALHRAHLEMSPGQHRNSKQPADWLKLEGTKDLIAAISNSEDPQVKPVDSQPGRYGGTFAHELLAVSYAGWISPRFQIQVNQTFIEYRDGTLTRREIPQTLSEALRLAADQAEQIEMQAEKIEQDAPKVAFHDQVVAGEDLFSVRDAAKLLGTGQNRLMSMLRREGWVTKKNEPYQLKIIAGVMDVKLHTYTHPEHGRSTRATPLVTGKGLAQLKSIMADQAA